MPNPPHAVVLHIRSSRPHDPAFQAELDMLNAAALDALEAEGFEAQLVAVTEVPEQEVHAIARAADVVLVMGGEDVEPTLYGGLAEYPGSGMHEPEADRVTFDGRGRRGDPQDFAFDLQAKDCEGRPYKRTISVSPTGQISTAKGVCE